MIITVFFQGYGAVEDDKADLAIRILEVNLQLIHLFLTVTPFNKGRHGTDPWPTLQCLAIFPTPQCLQNMTFIAYGGRSGTCLFSSVQ